MSVSLRIDYAIIMTTVALTDKQLHQLVSKELEHCIYLNVIQLFYILNELKLDNFVKYTI